MCIFLCAFELISMDRAQRLADLCECRQNYDETMRELPKIIKNSKYTREEKMFYIEYFLKYCGDLSSLNRGPALLHAIIAGDKELFEWLVATCLQDYNAFVSYGDSRQIDSFSSEIYDQPDCFSLDNIFFDTIGTPVFRAQYDKARSISLLECAMAQDPCGKSGIFDYLLSLKDIHLSYEICHNVLLHAQRWTDVAKICEKQPQYNVNFFMLNRCRLSDEQFLLALFQNGLLAKINMLWLVYALLESDLYDCEREVLNYLDHALQMRVHESDTEIIPRIFYLIACHKKILPIKKRELLRHEIFVHYKNSIPITLQNLFTAEQLAASDDFVLAEILIHSLQLSKSFLHTKKGFMLDPEMPQEIITKSGEDLLASIGESAIKKRNNSTLSLLLTHTALSALSRSKKLFCAAIIGNNEYGACMLNSEMIPYELEKILKSNAIALHKTDCSGPKVLSTTTQLEREKRKTPFERFLSRVGGNMIPHYWCYKYKTPHELAVPVYQHALSVLYTQLWNISPIMSNDRSLWYESTNAKRIGPYAARNIMQFLGNNFGPFALIQRPPCTSLFFTIVGSKVWLFKGYHSKRFSNFYCTFHFSRN